MEKSARPPDPPRSRETVALRVSLAGALALSTVAIAWGLVANAQVILLDGVYAALGMLLTGISLRVVGAVDAGATTRFPFGREAFTPMAVAAQGLALLAVCAYAAVSSVRSILAGGVDVAPGSVAAYAAISGLASYALFVGTQNAQGNSDLVRAEARQWLASTLFSGVVLAGSVGALLLGRADVDGVDRYLDPALVLIACTLLVREPLRLLRSGLGELLESSAPADIQQPVRRAVEAVRREHGLGEPQLRVSKLGRKVYVEADFVVAAGAWDVADEDAVRRAVADELADFPYDLWLNVELTTQPDLLA